MGQNNIWSAFYWKDYLGDTGCLSPLEHGVYFLLMANYYASEKPLPVDIKGLRRVCKAVSQKEKVALDYVLKKYFVRDGDVFRHTRIDEELAKRLEISGKRRDAVNTRYTNVPTNVEQLNTHTHTHTQRASGQKPATQLPPDFEPNDNNRKVAKEVGIEISAVLQAFKDFHLSKGNRHKDWNLALNTWLRRERQFGPAKKQPAPVTTGSALDNLRALEEKYK